MSKLIKVFMLPFLIWDLRRVFKFRNAVHFHEQRLLNFMSAKWNRFLVQLAQYKSDNPLICDANNEFSNIKAFMWRAFPIIVGVADFFLANKPIASLISGVDIGNGDLNLLIYVVVLMVVWIELIIGIAKGRSIFKEDGAVQDGSVGKPFWQKMATCLGLLFVLIIPFLALSEYNSQYSALLHRLTADPNFTEHAWKGQVMGLKFKYIALSLISTIGHFILVFWSDEVIGAYSRWRFQSKMKVHEETEEELLEEKGRLQSNLVQAALQFDESRKIHIAKFGKHDALPGYEFSEPVKKLFSYISGQQTAGGPV